MRESIRSAILHIMRGKYDKGVPYETLLQLIHERCKGLALLQDMNHIIKEELMDLMRLGILMPGQRIWNQQFSWQHFQVTEYGRQYIDSGKDVHYDAHQYLTHIKTIIPSGISLDEIVSLYARESVMCRRSGVYTASVVMLGTAAERIVLMLIKAVIDRGEHRFEKEVNAERGIKRKYVVLRNKLSSILSNTKDRVGTLDVFNVIRTNRNDAGHPTQISFDRAQAESLSHAFLLFIQDAYRILEELSRQKKP